MNVTIFPAAARGTVAAPASKSVAHRMMIGAALAEGASVLRGVTDSQDMLATLDCIAALGAACEKDGDVLTMRGVGGDLSRSAGVFPCRESGSTLRFFVPVSLLKEGTSVFTGSERLLQRGAAWQSRGRVRRGVRRQANCHAKDRRRRVLYREADAGRLRRAGRYQQPVYHGAAAGAAADRRGEYADDDPAGGKPPVY